MRLVFFDFDGTLTTRDTIWPFASFLSANQVRPGAARVSFLLTLLLLKLRLISNHRFKKHFLTMLLVGESKERTAGLVRQFHQTQLEPVLNPAMVKVLLDHVAAGDEVYLVSSNFDFFLEPLQERWNLKGILATQAEVLGGLYTGRILGRACDGKEKLARVVNCFGELRAREAVAYGDSRGDSFLLVFVKTGHWVGSRGGASFVRCHPA
jgi:HAD superfamily hydrolase (TIGR01490 family)